MASRALHSLPLVEGLPPPPIVVSRSRPSVTPPHFPRLHRSSHPGAAAIDANPGVSAPPEWLYQFLLLNTPARTSCDLDLVCTCNQHRPFSVRHGIAALPFICFGLSFRAPLPLSSAFINHGARHLLQPSLVSFLVHQRSVVVFTA